MQQRWLMNLAVRDYRNATDSFRSALAEQDKVIEAWWCAEELGERAFSAQASTPLLRRRDVENVLHHCGVRELTGPDALVLVVTGHGRISPAQRHYLELPDTVPDRLARTGYPTSDLVMAALASDAEHVVVIVNCCHAGQLDSELANLLKDLPSDRQRLGSLAVLSTGRFDERPRVVEFTELLRRVDAQLRTTSGIARPHLSVQEFRAELVRAARADPPLLEPLLLWPRAYGDTPNVCLPNPGYTATTHQVSPALAQASTPGGELEFWLDRASGRVSATDPGWYFAGRKDLNRALARFLREDSGLLIVTGAAGTGKSAIIAHAVTLSDPTLRTDPRVSAAAAAAPGGTLPPPGSIDAAVLARQKDTIGIATDLLTALGQNPATPAPGQSSSAVLRDQLADAISRSARPMTLVIDELDEATDPATVITDQLGPLLRLTGGDRSRPVRMIVGLRSAGGPDDPHALLTLLSQATITVDVQQVRTDGPDTRTDIADYLDRLMSVGPYAHDAVARRAAADTVADAVAPSFLDARLAGQRLREAAEIQDLDDPRWRRTLADGTVGLLRADLARIADSDPDAQQILAVLRATAFARGNGIPWAEVWPTVAEAVLDRKLDDVHTAIGKVVGGRLAGYLTRDVELGRVVYRPAHDLLARALRDSSHHLLDRS